MFGCFSMSTSCFLFFLSHQRVFRKEHQLVYFWPSGSYNNLYVITETVDVWDIKYFGNILSTFSRRRWRTSFWGNLKEDESFDGNFNQIMQFMMPQLWFEIFLHILQRFSLEGLQNDKKYCFWKFPLAHPKKEWVSNKYSVSPKQRFYV